MDNEEREPLVRPPRESQNRSYNSMQGQPDSVIAARIAMDHRKRERERRERIAKIKQKYNI